MNSNLSASLHQHFGFSTFRPGQAEAIQALLDGRSTLVVMPTGSGKSLVFQLAALLQPGLTIVISPLVALMKDQVDQLCGRGIAAAYINSSLESGEQSRRIRSLANGEYRLVYVAPERLRSSQFLNALKGQKISLLAVDEAHCISEWGHDFRPDFLQIAAFRENLGNPLTVALTATATPKVQDEIVRLLKLGRAERVVTGFNRPNLTLRVKYTTDPRGRMAALKGYLIGGAAGGSIIYTGTRRDAEEIAEFISTGLKIPCAAYHAGLIPAERSRIQENFLSGKLPVVAATNAFGMGIDRADVRRVIHYSMPGSLEAYYQEAGRAGRDGLPAEAILLYDPKDRALQEWFIKQNQVSQKDLRALYNALPAGRNQAEWITVDDLSAATGLQPVGIKVGLAALESAGALDRSGDEGMRIFGQRKAWNQERIQSTLAHLDVHQHHRTSQLEKMVKYAESNDCRRRIILNHFGDTGPATAAICCDNCQAHPRTSTPAQVAPQKKTVVAADAPIPPTSLAPVSNEVEGLPQSTRVALIILDTLHRLKQGLGREKVILILKGSQAKAIAHYGYDKFVYYGKLAVMSHDELESVIRQLGNLGLIKSVGGEYPVLKLTAAGETALREKSIPPITLPRQYSQRQIDLKHASRQAGGTVEFTAQMLAENLSVAEIARQRSLTIGTIYSHCARLIAEGRLQIERILPGDIRQVVEEAILKAGAPEPLSPVLNRLPADINPSLVRCVVEDWKLKHPSGD